VKCSSASASLPGGFCAARILTIIRFSISILLAGSPRQATPRFFTTAPLFSRFNPTR
jgi:hypothetical protein